MAGHDDNAEAVTRLLARMLSSDAEVPTGMFGRARRAAGAALRTGLGSLSARLSGGELDARAIGQLAASLGELKGIAMKAGQILSYLDTPLPEEARKLLAVLQTHSPTTPFETIKKIIREDFGARAGGLIEGLDPTPVASASIGQVHRGRVGGNDVAVKVLHPGIEQAIRSDFRAAAAGKLLAKMLMPGGDIESVIDEARETFLAECDYEGERRWQERFGALFSSHADISIPRVFAEWCSRRVLTTEWRTGLRFDELAKRGTQPARDRAGRALYEFYVGSVYRYGLFNGDPHPGNLLFSEDGALVVLDHGCVREFDPKMRSALVALSRAVRADREEEIRAALGALGGAVPDGRTYPTTRALLRGFFGPILKPGPHRVDPPFTSELRTIINDKRAVIRMRLPGRLLFLFRIRFGLHSELARLGAIADWASLEEQLTTRS